MSDDIYEVYAINYAQVERGRSANFLGGDPHDGPMPLHYYVWAIVGNGRTIIVDTGFDERGAKLRKRTLNKPIAEGLKTLGIEADTVKDVIITHMHYDHSGNNDLFPNAKFHLQDQEMAMCTGRCMCHPPLQHPYELLDVLAMVTRVYQGRVEFYDGEAELFPGISLHHVGGHARGLQVVRVKTRRGYVMLASDATHFYEHILTQRAYPTVDSVAMMMEGHKTVKRLASSEKHFIPGHDPLVGSIYPPAKPGLEDWVFRLDVEPKEFSL